MGRKISVSCPYCGKANYVTHDTLYNDNTLVRCDEMNGGCDKLFVVDVEVKLSAKTMKIFGEEEKECW